MSRFEKNKSKNILRIVISKDRFNFGLDKGEKITN